MDAGDLGPRLGIPLGPAGQRGRIIPPRPVRVILPAPAKAGVDGAIGSSRQIGSTP
jgi:hypothetical protein